MQVKNQRRERIMKRNNNIQSLLFRGTTERIWSALSELRYIFSHVLLRDAVYEMQLKSRLRDLHKLAGDTMVRLFPDDELAGYTEVDASTLLPSR